MVYSASGLLTAATEDSFLTDSLDGQTLAISQTVFSGWNMLAAAATILVVGLAMFLIAPRKGDPITPLEIDVRETADDGQEDIRSEEHTSELQSRFDLVCRLLLEKKNN